MALECHALRFWRHWVTVWVIVVLVLGAGYALTCAPRGFSVTTLAVAEGDSTAKVARMLADAQVISHDLPLRVLLRISGGDAQIRPGTYRFGAPENLFSIIRRLLTADYGLPSVKLTFPEGYTTREMAQAVHTALPAIAEAEFLRLARPHEGYLFPDTYEFQGSATASDIIERMRENFDTRMAKFELNGRSLGDTVIMASLLEKEARSEEHRKLVAGVLYNRLAKNMPLQVDAVFGYIFNRDTYSPRPEDLKVESPYNTYTHRGLPPGPINNPGIAALFAAANPTSTAYLYYLTGNDGTMHYATTYEGHKTNLAKYLK